MGFRLFGRKSAGQRDAAPQDTQAASPNGEAASVFRIVFDGLTEDWRLVGMMRIAERLSDALNAGGPLEISDVSWAPADGSGPLVPAPAFRSVDCEDLVLVFAGYDAASRLTAAERAARTTPREPRRVWLEAGPYVVRGKVLIAPDAPVESLLEASGPRFIPVVGAEVRLGDRQVGDPAVEVALVNRAAVRRIMRIAEPVMEPEAAPAGEPTPMASGTQVEDAAMPEPVPDAVLTGEGPASTEG